MRKGHTDRNKHKGKKIKQVLDCIFIRIKPDHENFDADKQISRLYTIIL